MNSVASWDLTCEMSPSMRRASVRATLSPIPRGPGLSRIMMNVLISGEEPHVQTSRCARPSSKSASNLPRKRPRALRRQQLRWQPIA